MLLLNFTLKERGNEKTNNAINLYEVLHIQSGFGSAREAFKMCFVIAVAAFFLFSHSQLKFKPAIHSICFKPTPPKININIMACLLTGDRWVVGRLQVDRWAVSMTPPHIYTHYQPVSHPCERVHI